MKKLLCLCCLVWLIPLTCSNTSDEYYPYREYYQYEDIHDFECFDLDRAIAILEKQLKNIDQNGFLTYTVKEHLDKLKNARRFICLDT